MGRLAAATVVAAVVACGSESILGPVVEGDIAMQRSTWEARAIDNYNFTLTYSNMWVGPMRSLVQVRGGAVAGCWDPSTGQPRDVSETWLCRTIDQIFDDAEARLASSDGWDVTLRYDANLGLIRSMWADVPGWADEEYGYSVTSFNRR
jgi:hypothetical protein